MSNPRDDNPKPISLKQSEFRYRSGTTIELKKLEEKMAFLEVEGTRTNMKLRKHLCWCFFGLFSLLNIFTVVLIFVISKFDYELAKLALKSNVTSPPSHVVSAGVVMSIVGSTAVQSGAAIIIVMKYLFPKK